MAVFDVMKSVIAGKSVPVGELRARIDVFFAQGRISGEEKAVLEEMVFDNQSPGAEKPEPETAYAALVERMNALEERVAALEGGVSGDQIPEWKAWDGVSQDYLPGAIVQHGGKVWESVYPAQNVWEPGAVGIDERYWVVIEV